jgi:hypothetical protein
MALSVRAEWKVPILQFAFRPDAALICTTGKFIKDFYDQVFDDPDATSRVVLTIHELLENIAKYSSDGVGDLVVQLVARDGQHFVQIRTRNTSTPSRSAQVSRLLDEVRAARDPVQLYYRLIRESAERTEGSGLGLARVRAEGEMDVDYAVRGNEVTIVAQAPVRLRGEGMDTLQVPSFQSDSFSIQGALDSHEIAVKCVGNGGIDATPVVDRYLRDLHAEAHRLGVAEVVVDFSELYFMNSSCFKCFASWLSAMLKGEGGKAYRVRFVSNPNLRWQLRSLEALRCLAPQLVDITDVGGPLPV